MAPREGSPRRQRFCFFLLDDVVTWVAAWDADGRFIPGPYKKWYLDPDTGVMRRMKTPLEGSGLSRVNAVAREA